MVQTGAIEPPAAIAQAEAGLIRARCHHDLSRSNPESTMLDHVTIGVSDIERSRRFTILRFVLLVSNACMPTVQASRAMAPAGKHSSGSASERLRKPAPTSPLRPRTGKPCSNFTGRRSRPGDKTTDHRGCARIITKTTMGRSSLIQTATTSRRSATASNRSLARASA